MSRAVPRITLASGSHLPALGMGTWRMGERTAHRAREVAALRLGIDLGMRLIDTAEMYGEGGAENLIGEAIAGRREEVFLVSKVYPQNATRRGVVAACERSLKRLRTDWLDLYLLHWRGEVPLRETIAGFETLRASGKIRHWGVSNLDTGAMKEMQALPLGEHCAADQVLYHLRCRGIEWDLLPLCRRTGVVVMAYSPFDEGRLLRDRHLTSLARRLGSTPAQLALAWLLGQKNVVVIPKASDAAHVEDNRRALALRISHAVAAEIDRLFPPPAQATPLAMI